MAFFSVRLKERPDFTVIFNDAYVTKMVLSGDACGIHHQGIVGETRITRDQGDKLRIAWKVQNVDDLPGIVRHTEQR